MPGDVKKTIAVEQGHPSCMSAKRCTPWLRRELDGGSWGRAGICHLSKCSSQQRKLWSHETGVRYLPDGLESAE